MGFPVDEKPTETQEAQPLAELLPADMADACDAVSDPTDFGNGARAAYPCSLPEDSVNLIYVQYTDAAATAAAFAAEAAAVPSVGDCSQGQPVRTSWSDAGGRTIGELACFTGQDGTSVMTWSTAEHHTLAYAVTDRSLAQHYAWWLTLAELG